MGEDESIHDVPAGDDDADDVPGGDDEVEEDDDIDEMDDGEDDDTIIPDIDEDGFTTAMEDSDVPLSDDDFPMSLLNYRRRRVEEAVALGEPVAPWFARPEDAFSVGYEDFGDE